MAETIGESGIAAIVLTTLGAPDAPSTRPQSFSPTREAMITEEGPRDDAVFSAVATAVPCDDATHAVDTPSKEDDSDKKIQQTEMVAAKKAPQWTRTEASLSYRELTPPPPEEEEENQDDNSGWSGGSVNTTEMSKNSVLQVM